MTINVFQAITTKYLGPSNFRGSRIKAKAAEGSITISYDDRLNSEQAHAQAAEALARKFKWEGRYFQGGLPDDRGYCFVCTADYQGSCQPAFVIERETKAA